MKLLFYLIIPFFLISCVKDGEVGPKGEEGIPGKNGSTILSGKISPTSEIGKGGDFYLNLSTGDLYGPKNELGWGQPFNLKGNKGEIGAPGKDGSSLLSGETDPSMSIGKEGDYYINKRELTLFGPKTSKSWGGAVSLKEDNEIKVYYFSPIFDQNVILEKDVNPNSDYRHKITANTKLFEFPGRENEVILEFYSSVCVSRECFNGNLSMNKWTKLEFENTYPYISTSLDPIMYGVKVSLNYKEELESESLKYYFTISGNVYAELTHISEKHVAFLVKSFPVTKMENLSKEYSNPKRFLRISD